MDTMDSLLDDEEMVCGLLIYRFGGFQRFLGWFSLHWVDPLNGFFSMQTGRWTWVNLRGWKLSTLTPPFQPPLFGLFLYLCQSQIFSCQVYHVFCKVWIWSTLPPLHRRHIQKGDACLQGACVAGCRGSATGKALFLLPTLLGLQVGVPGAFLGGLKRTWHGM